MEDVADYENPKAYPTGIDYVLVNGQLVIDRARPSTVRVRAGFLRRQGYGLERGARVAVLAALAAGSDSSLF